MSLWLTATVYFALGCFLAGMTLSLYRLLFEPSAQDITGDTSTGPA